MSREGSPWYMSCNPEPCGMQPGPYNPAGVSGATSSCHVLITQGPVHSPGTPIETTAKPGTPTHAGGFAQPFSALSH